MKLAMQLKLYRRCSSVVEHFLGKEEVKGSIPFNGSEVLLSSEQNDEVSR